MLYIVLCSLLFFIRYRKLGMCKYGDIWLPPDNQIRYQKLGMCKYGDIWLPSDKVHEHVGVNHLVKIIIWLSSFYSLYCFSIIGFESAQNSTLPFSAVVLIWHHGIVFWCIHSIINVIIVKHAHNVISSFVTDPISPALTRIKQPC